MQRERSIQFGVCKQAYAPFKRLKDGVYRRTYGCRQHEAERCRRIKVYGLRDEWQRYDQWSPIPGARLVATHPVLLEDNKTILTIHDEPVTTDDVLVAQIMLLTADEQAELVRLGVINREVPPPEATPGLAASCAMPSSGRENKNKAARRKPRSKPKTPTSAAAARDAPPSGTPTSGEMSNLVPSLSSKVKGVKAPSNASNNKAPKGAAPSKTVPPTNGANGNSDGKIGMRVTATPATTATGRLSHGTSKGKGVAAGKSGSASNGKPKQQHQPRRKVPWPVPAASAAASAARDVLMQDGALMVPCEICQVPIPFDNLLAHLSMEHEQRVGLPLKKRQFEGSDVPMQCTFCGDIVPIAKYDAHFARHLDVGTGRNRKRSKQRGQHGT